MKHLKIRGTYVKKENSVLVEVISQTDFSRYFGRLHVEVGDSLRHRFITKDFALASVVGVSFSDNGSVTRRPTLYVPNSLEGLRYYRSHGGILIPIHYWSRLEAAVKEYNEYFKE